MNEIKNIEIKYIGDLGYSIKFHFLHEGRSIKKIVLGDFETVEELNLFDAKSINWKSRFSHWTFGVDEKISIDLKQPILDHLLVIVDGIEVSLFDFVGYIIKSN